MMSVMAGMVFAASAFGSEYFKVMAPPTSLFLDDEISKESGEINDNTIAGQFVGTINANGGDGPFTFTLVEGEGDTDNSLFEIRGDSLYTAAYIDYETHTEALSIRVQADNGTDVQAFPISMPITDLQEGDFGGQGNEILVNTPTTNSQTNSAIARDANGNFVIVWQDRGFAIYAQRYDAQAKPIGGSIRVSNLNIGAELPDVAMADDGSFVVVWQGESQDGDGTAIAGKMFSNEAVAGTEFVVNSTIAGSQTNPKVAMNATGAFAVTWEGAGGADPDGVYVRTYSADGTPSGLQVPVNTTTADVQSDPNVAIDDNGNFVVVWTSQDQVDPASLGDIYFRSFASNLTGGTETLVNITTSNDQSLPDIAMDGNGAFIVVWQSEGQDGSLSGVYMQQFTNAGVAQGMEDVLVNSQTTGNQSAPSVSVNNNGGFAVAYTGINGTDNNNREIRVRRFLNGTAGADIEVNKIRPAQQRFPDIVINENGNFVICWESSNNGNYAIYAQRFYSNTAPTDISLDNTNIADGSMAGAPVGVFSTTDADAGDKFGYALVAGDGDTDNASFSIQANQLVLATTVDMATKASYSIRVRGLDALGASFDKAFTITVVEGGAIPVIATNNGVSLTQGGTVTISQDVLAVTDEDNTAEEITYTLVTLPANGTVQKDGTALEANGTFTQADINNGLITYVHDNTATTTDAFGFTVNDGQGGAVAETTFAITIGAASGAPTANAGADQTIADEDGDGMVDVVLDGSASTDDGTIASYAWIENESDTLATEVNPTVSLAVGVHTIALVVTDDEGMMASDTVVITVSAAGAPTANAGDDQTVTDEDGDGMADVVLDGSASTDDGNIASYAWIENESDTLATEVNPTVSLAVGVHTIALVVTDDEGMMASDTVIVTINEAGGENTAPVVSVNEGLNLAQQGDTVTITSEQLEVTDAESAPEAIIYTLTVVPTQGTLQRDGTDLAANGTFTQKDIDDGLIRYANSASSEASDSFSFTATDGGITTEETSFAITISVVTAIGDDIDNKLITVYPNPSQQVMFVKMDKQTHGDIRVKVSNSMGQLLKSVQLDAQNSAQHPIDISNLSKGTYFVRIEADNQTIIKKLIKE
uniref:Cadherin-like domain-containing protein n=1 Tax=Roseihalotalea indica TaxID=2867963 RepID=A0AA49GS03_9BACT|nr:cadherin-like domain-containing protein [Tunicatimonas sp. TK19036]